MKKKTFIKHLKNVRNFTKFFIIFAILLFIFLYIIFKNSIINVFIKIINNMGINYINYLNIYEGFLLPFKLIFYIWVFILGIIFIISFFIFIENNYFNFYFLGSLPLIIYGNFKYLIPLSWKNLYSIKPISGMYLITSNEILNFIINVNLCGFIIFYLPFLFIILYVYQIISQIIFNKIKKYWNFLSIIISGIIAPGDMVSHIVMSLLMILVFNILWLIVLIYNKLKSL